MAKQAVHLSDLGGAPEPTGSSGILQAQECDVMNEASVDPTQGAKG